MISRRQLLYYSALMSFFSPIATLKKAAMADNTHQPFLFVTPRQT